MELVGDDHADRGVHRGIGGALVELAQGDGGVGLGADAEVEGLARDLEAHRDARVVGHRGDAGRRGLELAAVEAGEAREELGVAHLVEGGAAGEGEGLDGGAGAEEIEGVEGEDADGAVLGDHPRAPELGEASAEIGRGACAPCSRPRGRGDGRRP
jgi:hypothetical protein